MIDLDDRITEHFRWSEIAYHHGGLIYLPGVVAMEAIRRTCELILEPLRMETGQPIHIVRGGGYDPLRDADGGWISHRRSETTQHHLGGALDFRVGTHWASGPFDVAAAAAWVERRLQAIGIPGGLGVYEQPRNRFVHVDLRSHRARWHD